MVSRSRRGGRMYVTGTRPGMPAVVPSSRAARAVPGEDGAEGSASGEAAARIEPARAADGRTGRASPEARAEARSGRQAERAGLIPATALLPLRLFVGFTFVYAGIDKLALDSSFLDLSSPTSILAQLHGYERASPLAPLIAAIAVPNAWLMGVTIALAEIAVGLGLLTGLAYRLAAGGGAALSFLFFLTASWNVHPYYFGQDLPYMIGFVTLAVAGHGDRYVLGPWLERQFAPRARSTGRRGRGAPVPASMSPERRLILHAALVGAGAIAIAIVVRPLRDLLLPPGQAGAGALTSPGSGGAGAGASAGTSAGTGASGPGGASALEIATTAAVVQAGAFQFQVPVQIGNASPGDPGIVVSLGSNSFAAFDAICTHAGCTVGWDPSAGLLVCPCHGAAYDPRHNAQPVAGPTNIPLTELPISIANGQITLRA